MEEVAPAHPVWQSVTEYHGVGQTLVEIVTVPVGTEKQVQKKELPS